MERGTPKGVVCPTGYDCHFGASCPCVSYTSLPRPSAVTDPARGWTGIMQSVNPAQK